MKKIYTLIIILTCLCTISLATEKPISSTYDLNYRYLCDTLTRTYVGGDNSTMKAYAYMEGWTEDYYRNRYTKVDSINIDIFFSKRKTQIGEIKWDAVVFLSDEKQRICGEMLYKRAENTDSLFTCLQEELTQVYGSPVDTICNNYVCLSWPISDNTNLAQLSLKGQTLTLTYYNTDLCYVSPKVIKSVETLLTRDLNKDRDRIIIIALIIFILLVINEKYHLTSKALFYISTHFNVFVAVLCCATIGMTSLSLQAQESTKVLLDEEVRDFMNLSLGEKYTTKEITQAIELSTRQRINKRQISITSKDDVKVMNFQFSEEFIIMGMPWHTLRIHINESDNVYKIELTRIVNIDNRELVLNQFKQIDNHLSPIYRDCLCLIDTRAEKTKFFFPDKSSYMKIGFIRDLKTENVACSIRISTCQLSYGLTETFD